MAWNLFPRVLALDEQTGDTARNAVGQVFAIEDLARSTPLPIQDATGVALAGNVATSNRLGVVQRFRVENRKVVIWKSGSHEVEVTSIDALVADVESAVSAAQSAAAAAQSAATSAANAATANDSAVAAFVSTPGSATNTAVISVAGSAGSGDGGGGDASVDTLSGATEVGKAVMKAVDQAAGRTAIGAGTSSLKVGPLATDAAAGNDVLRLVGTAAQRTTRPTEFAGGITLADDSIQRAWVAGLDEALAAAATPAGVVFQTDVYKPVRRTGANVDGAWPSARPTGNWLGMEWIGADPDPVAAIMAAGDIRTEVL